MEEAGSSKDRETQGESRYASMSKSELEALAVSAIRDHRALLAADQAVYEEWLRASDDPSVSGTVRQTLQDEYLARQKKSEAQQKELSDILDALGFVPNLPFDDGNESSDETAILSNRNKLSN